MSDEMFKYLSDNLISLPRVGDLISYNGEDYTVLFTAYEQIVAKRTKTDSLIVIDNSDYIREQRILRQEIKDSLELDRQLNK